MPATSSRPNRTPLLVGGGVAVVLVAVVLIVVAASGGRSDPSTPAAAGSSGASTSAPGGSVTVPTLDPSATSSTFEPSPSTTVDGAQPLPAGSPSPTFGVAAPKADQPIPLAVALSSTSGLSDGQVVSIKVTPDGGSQVYGLEVFVCAPNETFTQDADVRSTQSGKCISKRISAKGDDYKFVKVGPPYREANVTFRVPVGSDTFLTDEGRPVTITCGPGHPCQLVMKLQYPDGFGFRAYPLSYG